MKPAIAIDLGGTHATLGVVRGDHLVASRDIPLSAASGLARVLPILQDGVSALLEELKLRPADCMGLSLSLPSLVDFTMGRVASVNDKFPDAKEVNLSAWCAHAFGLELVVENDARAALLGEVAAGSARGVRDVVMITLGTGIGCSVMADGVLFRTRQPQGGNLGGHIPVRLDGRPCTCGARGCMESEASGWALPIIAKQMPGFAHSSLAGAPKLDFAAVFAHSDQGDALASRLVEHCIHVWSVGAVGLIHAYGPELLVVGGGVSARASQILPAMETYARLHAWTPAGQVRMVRAELGNNAPLYAAAPLLEEKGRWSKRG